MKQSLMVLYFILDWQTNSVLVILEHDATVHQSMMKFWGKLLVNSVL